MSSLRSHQQQMSDIAGQVIAGTWGKNSVTLDCTPGGGKTGAATIFANRLLDAGVCDRVLWLVPRLTLASQVCDAFEKGPGHRTHRRLQVADFGDMLFPPTLPGMPVVVGSVSTYQSLASRENWKRFRDQVADGRTLMIFDEVQFLNNDLESGWHSKVCRVRDVAAFVLLMSGTLWRTDRDKIPFIEYERRGDGKDYPQSDVSYTLRQAVTERAILPTEWRNLSGTVEYQYAADTHNLDLLDDDGDEESRKIQAFLASEKAVRALIDRAVIDWNEWRQRVYQSRGIVIANDIAEAQRWRNYLRDHHKIHCTLATSKEERAGSQLRNFRERREGQWLVTVAMAYVGFDCPDLTHMVYLSSTRAPAWMLQSAARVSRVDSKAPVSYDGQHAFIYAPDDSRIRQFSEWVRAETEVGIEQRRERSSPFAARDLVEMPDDFEPISAEVGTCAVESLHRRLDPDVVARLDAFAASCPAAADLPRSKLFEILTRAGVDLDAVRAAP